MRRTSIAAVLALSGAACGQCEWRFSIHQGEPGLPSGARALARFDPDGAGPLPQMLFAGGSSIAAAGLEPASRIAAYDGQRWRPVGAGVDGGAINAMAVYKGVLIVAGAFTTAGGQPAQRIAGWNGTSWSPLGSGINGEVFALASYGGQLYAGGSFAVAGGAFADRIARWNGSSWSSVGTGITGGVAMVSSMSVMDGNLYVGGEFTGAGGIAVSNLARWNGASWSNPGNVNGRVNAVAGRNDALGGFGTLYITGAFTSVAGVPANKVARLSGLTPVWSAMGSGLPADGRKGLLVRSVGATSHEVLAVTAEGAGRVRRWTASGWVEHGPAFTGSGPEALDFYGGRYIVATGAKVHFLDSAHNTWAPLGPGLQSAPTELEVYGGELYIAGGFDYVSNERHNRIVRWNGTQFSPVGGGIVGQVYAMRAFGGELFVGGAFSEAGGVPAGSIARWNGTAWSTAGTSPNGVTDLEVHNGELYLSGSFGGAVRRWTGSQWQVVGLNPLPAVGVICSYGGHLFAGGGPNMIASSHTARFDAAAGMWVPVAVPTPGFAPLVLDMEAFGGSMFIGGEQFEGGSLPRGLLRMTSPTGQAAFVDEVQFVGAVGAQVRELHSYGGALYASGRISHVGGQSSQGFAKFDGAVWTPPGGTIAHYAVSPIAEAMAVYQDELVIGGAIASVSGQVSRHWARWHCEASCYANCDGSTTAPVLNVADFTCFLQRFAGGESYANCDQSTAMPTLNVADFTCFLQRFAAGCP